MKAKNKTRPPCQFQVKILGYGNAHYIELIARLESALARKAKRVRTKVKPTPDRTGE